jgi:acetyltransferase-like isoleucine patch superfamily enzyme
MKSNILFIQGNAFGHSYMSGQLQMNDYKGEVIMSQWIGYMLKRTRDMKNKIITLLLYKSIFYQIGSQTTLSSPLYTHHPEYIKIGHRVFIGPSCRIEAHPANPKESKRNPILTIGNGVTLGHRVLLSSRHSLVIEDNVLIAGGCYVSDNNHAIDPEGPRYLEQPLTFAPTKIGQGAWLGHNVCVLAGAHIGERSVIGAGSVVRGIIPPYCIAVGAPARVVKRYSFKKKQWVSVKNWEAEIDNDARPKSG